jgi:predicted ferric reductase
MVNSRGRYGWYVFMALALAPVFFWLAAQPLTSRLIDWQTTLTSVGQLLGLIGMAMFSLNLVLSARLKILEPYFDGLNRIYLNHHTFGATAFILLLFHPLLLVTKYIPISLTAAAEFFLPSGNSAVTYGIFGLSLMMVLLAITFYGKFPYQSWKSTHQYLGLAFFLASLHVFFITSDVSRALPLRVYMLTLVAFGLAGIIYRTLLSNLLVLKYRYQVKAVREVNNVVLEIELAPKGKTMAYRPGQFIFISFSQPGISGEYHPFTISSSPLETGLRLTVKHLGDFTGDLRALTAGSDARIEGPFGKFSFLEVELKRQIWVAGGIGITPFLSMARSLKKYSGYGVDLFYCVKTAAEAVFIGELEAIAKETGQLRVILFCADEKGYISAEQIDKTCGLAGKEIFVCGPAPLMKSLKDQFDGLKIPRWRVHSEEFAIL